MENPATWGPAEHVIDDVLRDDRENKAMAEPRIGASLPRRIADALRAEGLLVDGEEVGVREAAQVLGVHENTIRNMVNDGRLHARELPGSGFRRIPLTEIQRLRSE